MTNKAPSIEELRKMPLDELTKMIDNIDFEGDIELDDEENEEDEEKALKKFKKELREDKD